MRLSRRELIGIALVVLALGAFWLWTQQRAVPLPPNAVGVESDSDPLARQTSFSSAWSEEQLRAFFRSELPGRGWRYCGTQTTPGCTKLFDTLSTDRGVVDVYRRADDADGHGPTVEIWPTQRASDTRVTIYESRPE